MLVLYKRAFANLMLPYQYRKALWSSKLNLKEFDLVVMPAHNSHEHRKVVKTKIQGQIIFDTTGYISTKWC